MNKLLFVPIFLLTIVPTLALAVKSDVAGGYNTGFARGVEEAHKAVAQFNNGQISAIDGNKPPPCPIADKQDYCDGWKDGWEKTIVKELD